MTAPAKAPAFDLDELLDAARAAAGTPDFDDFEHLDALARLTASLDTEGGLTEQGRPGVRGALVGCLATQAKAKLARRARPEIADVRIERPVFITGMTRSGTTFMHNLLREHPDLRSPDLWELMTPVSDTQGEDPALVAGAQAFVDDYYRLAPALPAAHFWEARRPDECHRLTAPTFKTMAYELRYRVPSYGEWLAGQDQFDAYDHHRDLLQHILWRVPAETVLMKCPFHLWKPDALTRTYPDARILHMRRAPSVTIPSTCSLTEIIRASRSDSVDRHELGEFWTRRLREAVDALPEQLAKLPATASVLDVDYKALMKDPIATVGGICDFLGLPVTGAAERAFRRYLEENPQGRHGSHAYRAEDYGLDVAALDELFADYDYRPESGR
ncbi:sulfotransferase family protein [Kitasatospora sp. NPDC004240]